MRSKLVIGVGLRNSRPTIRAALSGALEQRAGRVPIGVLILDDASTDGWEHEVPDLLANARVAVARVSLGSAWRARNALLALAERLCPTLAWHARLDADDVLRGASSVRRLVAAAASGDIVAVLGGNRQVSRGKLLRWPNRADETLLDEQRLLGRLDRMARLVPEAELPSCNLLLRAGHGFRYPAIASGEDHWLVARLLLTRRAQVRVVPDLLYCNYTLGGAVTSVNARSPAFLESRVRLAAAARRWLRARRP